MLSLPPMTRHEWQILHGRVNPPGEPQRLAGDGSPHLRESRAVGRCTPPIRKRKFYRVYPIANTLYSQLNWSQYKLLIAIPEKEKREYYELEALHNGWTKRELERQINSLLWERLLLSNDKDSVLAVAKKERMPEDNETILAAKYKLHLPNESQLLAEMRKIEAEYKSAHEESNMER